MQQGLARLLGVINYNTHPKSLPEAIDYLLDTVKPTVSEVTSVKFGPRWLICSTIDKG